MNLNNKDCFRIGYNKYVMEKVQVCGTYSSSGLTIYFLIVMYNLKNPKQNPLKTIIIIHVARVGFIVDYINNIDLTKKRFKM